MEITTTVDGTQATLRPIGKLTVAATSTLEAAFASLPKDAIDITLDLTDLAYVASAGLRVIVSRDKQARSAGGGVRLVHPNDEVMEVFDATGLIDILEIEP